MELKSFKNDQDRKHKILGVEPDSIAMELGITAGDWLISINGKEVLDALDYHLMVQEEYIDLVIFNEQEQEPWLYEIEKDEEEDLGLIFDNNLMDEFRSCRNQCVFCFIDQLPDGMRETLYFKDDDARLSFLQGNYITLTNMTDREIDRIIEYHLSPINISIHTMNTELRETMLKNRFAGRIHEYMERLHKAGITMNGQIVLCKGLNDGEELIHSIKAFEQYMPHLQSVSVVPVGLSKHRDGLYPLEPFDRDEAEAVLDVIHEWQSYYLSKYDTHLVHAGDEFYLLAGREVPLEDNYDGYLQLENGVGMLRLLMDSWKAAVELLERQQVEPITITLATGMLMAEELDKLRLSLEAKVVGLSIDVVGIENQFFGPQITVSGLLVGEDIIHQLSQTKLGDVVLLPDNVLRSGEEILLDDVSLEQLKEAIAAPLSLVAYTGETLVADIMGHTRLMKEL